MGQKKIILLATSDINYDQRIQRIAKSLHEFGAEVHVLGRSLPGSVPLLKKPFTQERVRCIFNQGVLFYVEITIRFFAHLMRNSYDCVCANDPDTLLAAIKAKLFKQFDLIYDSHEYFTEVPELQGKQFKKSVWKAVERNGVKKAKRVYTVNKSLAKILEDQYGKKFGVVKNVPNLGASFSPMNNDQFIIYQGALNKGRGLEQMIEAMKDIPLKLVIAGNGDLESELKQLVLDYNLTGKVDFIGKILPKELRDITVEAWLGVNLLEAQSLNYYYSLANKFFDYMHAEVPSLNMDFPEYKSMLTNNLVGVTIEKLNAENIALAINSLLEDSESYDRMKLNCKSAKAEYNWQKESLQLKEIYGL